MTKRSCPVEAVVADALSKLHTDFNEDAPLDFECGDVGIEVKQFYSARAVRQMEGRENAILIQGRKAAEMVAGWADALEAAERENIDMMRIVRNVGLALGWPDPCADDAPDEPFGPWAEPSTLSRAVAEINCRATDLSRQLVEAREALEGLAVDARNRAIRIQGKRWRGHELARSSASSVYNSMADKIEAALARLTPSETTDMSDVFKRHPWESPNADD